MITRNTVFCIFFVLMMMACASRKEDAQHSEHPGEAAEGDSDWREMDEFHVIMAETFHPYKDSANLEPAKARAGELVSAAERWESAALPARVDNDGTRAKLRQLRSEATALAESVRMGDELVIGQRLSELHDTFHELQEAWYGGH